MGVMNVKDSGYAEDEISLLSDISKAVSRAAKYSFWRNKCLEQSLTAKQMLTRRKITSTIYIGVKKNENKIEAHAWLKSDGIFITGEKNHSNFQVVKYYT